MVSVLCCQKLLLLLLLLMWVLLLLMWVLCCQRSPARSELVRLPIASFCPLPLSLPLPLPLPILRSTARLRLLNLRANVLNVIKVSKLDGVLLEGKG